MHMKTNSSKLYFEKKKREMYMIFVGKAIPIDYELEGVKNVGLNTLEVQLLNNATEMDFRYKKCKRY